MSRTKGRWVVFLFHRAGPRGHRGRRWDEIERRRVLLRSLCVVSLFLLAALSGIATLTGRLTPVDSLRFPSHIEVETPSGTRTILTFQKQLIAAIDEAEIPLGEEDRLSLPADRSLLPGESYLVRIDDRHIVRLSWNGIVVATVAPDGPVASLAAEAGYDPSRLTGEDRIELGPTGGVVGEGTSLAYIRMRSVFTTKQESVPFATVYVDDPTNRKGYTTVVQSGKNGILETTFEDVYENDLLRTRRQTKVETIRKPVSKIVRRGSSDATTLAIRSMGGVISSRYNAIKAMLVTNGSYNYKSFKDNGDGTLTVDGRTFTIRSQSNRVITAYDGVEWCSTGHRDPVKYPNCITPREHTTFSGLPARRGVVATYGFKENGRWVATRLPMGTVVFVERYGLAVIGDIHHVTSNVDLIDVSYDPREVLDGYRLGKTSRRVFILDFP